MEKALNIINMVFDAIKKYLFLVFGREDEIEGEVPKFPWEK